MLPFPSFQAPMLKDLDIQKFECQLRKNFPNKDAWCNKDTEYHKNLKKRMNKGYTYKVRLFQHLGIV